jgi:hypothetical protein
LERIPGGQAREVGGSPPYVKERIAYRPSMQGKIAAGRACEGKSWRHERKVRCRQGIEESMYIVYGGKKYIG